MSERVVPNGSDKLVLTLKSAYTVALVIIATMALIAYLLIQDMMAAQKRDESLLHLIEAQKTNSQRIVFLVNAARTTPPDGKPALLSSLKAATTQFERNYDALAHYLAAKPDGPDIHEVGTVTNILFGAPNFLDYFSTTLAANGYRFFSALETELGKGTPATQEVAPAPLDEKVADATLRAYTALANRLSAESRNNLERMLSTHRVLFFATIVVICFVGLFIFRPMTEMIRKRTHELVEARNSMAFLAVHDGLTGLYNRAYMRDHFDKVLAVAARRAESVAVIQIDLDSFKQINDTLGHAAGDHVLKVTAERMRQNCRASDICARLGGDEFLMVLPAAGSAEHIDGLAARILAALNQPMVFEGATCTPGASAGIAVYPSDAETADDLLVHADLALYAAKKLGGGQMHFFSEDLRQELDHRKNLEQDIREAIDAESFDVFFQPQVSLSEGMVTGVEALLRWNHPERGMIAPAEFIPVAERGGLMPQVGRIVMRKAIANAAEWQRRGLRFGRLALNVSSSELREAGFSKFLFDTLEEFGLPAQKLALEIVESVILDDEGTGIAAKLRVIRAAGVHLELDDFGTGYASLSHVNPNEIDRLKIDRRFVQNINANGDNTMIVRAITELARGLGISIIAEGAETEAELALLMAIGCNEVQGYSIAFPMPEGQAGDWLAARSPRKPTLTVVESSRA